MPQFSTDLFVDAKIEQKESPFSDNEPLLFADESQSISSSLNTLSFRVLRKPRDLMAHLRRIYFCYQNALGDPLYAALLDFLIILNGKGRKISTRLVQGSHSHLNDSHVSAVKSALKAPRQVSGNRYSLFTTGVIGITNVIEVSNTVQGQHDYLKLADDFIEYSQLDEAMSILEQGLDEYPEREELQVVLLELYKSTDSRERFNQRYEMIKTANVPFVKEWQILAHFFDGKSL